jgi:hypothetical protein
MNMVQLIFEAEAATVLQIQTEKCLFYNNIICLDPTVLLPSAFVMPSSPSSLPVLSSFQVHYFC